MEFLKLYDEENKDLLYSMSWLNKNSIFDKSTGSFEEIDLFTFLENINQFDYEKDTFYDDIYYILEYTKDSILHLINNINKEIKREHKILPISQAKEFDHKTILWLSRQDGRTIKEKLKNNKIKTVKRYRNVDTYENRVFKIFLKKLVLIYEIRTDLQDPSIDHLFNKIRLWLRGDDAKSINEYKKVVYNNILLHHQHYSKIFKSYKRLNRLDEKINTYSAVYPKQLKTIIKFEVLTQLQFFTTDIKVLPTTLDSDDLSSLDINVNNCLIKIDLENYISQIKDNMINEKLPFKAIQKFAQYMIQNQIKIKNFKNRTFSIDVERFKEVYIDLFRLFPIAKLNDEIINFPITLKQKVDSKIVNANNTKIIDLNNEMYTLPEILKTYNISVLKYFLEDLRNFFKDKQLNYIIPDYVNIFEFSQVKKNINSYFAKNRNIPKSILAGLDPLLKGTIQENDTLIYIQKDHENDLYVTPLLVKYDENLQSITNGLYLEKHPTKKLQEESDVLDELNKSLNNKELSQNLLSKFLQNGIKGIKKQHIAFYLDENIIYLQNSKKISKEKNRIKQIKALFHNKNLFKNEFIELRDENKDNLYNFEKLLNYEKDGFSLWKEHLPRLAMQLAMKGYFGEFTLVDENSEIINGNIKIENYFKIPANTKEELSFPLILGDENINFEAFIASSELPLKEDVECELELTYNYEAETPYKLTFIALDKSIKPLKVKWREIQYRECFELPIPSYPPKKSWDDFMNFQNQNKKSINVLELMEDNFRTVIELNAYFNNCSNQLIFLKDVNFDWFQDRKSFYAAKLHINGIGEVFFHQNNFENFNKDIDSITFKLQKSRKGGFQAVNIVEGNKIPNGLIRQLKKDLRFALLTIWNNGNSLSDINVPINFRLLAKDAIEAAEEILHLGDIDIELESTMLFFLASLHQDAPEIIIHLLDIYSKKSEKNNIIPYSLGHMKLDWQKDIFKNILNNIKLNRKLSDNLKIFGIVAWRYHDFIIKLTKSEYTILISKLYKSLVQDMKKDYIYSYSTQRKCNEIYQTIVNKLELLLALIRYRMNDECALKPNLNLTKQYVKLIDDITIIVVSEKLNIYSRIQLNITKSEIFKNTPDLLYALRIYLTGNSGAANTIKILGVSDD